MRFFKPEVISCQVKGCSFNRDKACHALSISVGGPHQECDTFDTAENNGHHETGTTSVGVCNVPSCVYNKNNLCQSDGINLAAHENHADCMTYKQA